MTETAAKTQATHCCVCSRPLTEAGTTATGLGKACAARYFDPAHVPTPAMVQAATTLLDQPDFSFRYFDGIRSALRAGDPRKAADTLVYLAACAVDFREELFKYAAVLRALGYTDLAERLELDQVAASVTSAGPLFRVITIDRRGLVRNLALVPGATRLLEPGVPRRKFGWTVPVEQEDYLMAVLGAHLGGEWMCGTGGLRRVPPRQWLEVVTFRGPVIPVNPTPPTQPRLPLEQTTLTTDLPGGGTVKIMLPGTDGHILLFTPYQDGFVGWLQENIPQSDRTWTGTCWRVDGKHHGPVLGAVNLYFGTTFRI